MILAKIRNIILLMKKFVHKIGAVFGLIYCLLQGNIDLDNPNQWRG